MCTQNSEKASAAEVLETNQTLVCVRRSLCVFFVREREMSAKGKIKELVCVCVRACLIDPHK